MNCWQEVKMAEPKFTPASWEWRVLRTGSKQYVIVNNGDRNCGTAICTMDLTYKLSKFEATAHANLIKTSPKMYNFIARLVNSGSSLDILKIVEEGELLLAEARGET